MLWRISIEKLQMTLKEFLLEGLKTFLNMRAERESDAAKWRETFPPAEVTPLAPSATALEAAEREREPPPAEARYSFAASASPESSCAPARARQRGRWARGTEAVAAHGHPAQGGGATVGVDQ